MFGSPTPTKQTCWPASSRAAATIIISDLLKAPGSVTGPPRYRGRRPCRGAGPSRPSGRRPRTDRRSGGTRRSAPGGVRRRGGRSRRRRSPPLAVALRLLDERQREPLPHDRQVSAPVELERHRGHRLDVGRDAGRVAVRARPIRPGDEDHERPRGGHRPSAISGTTRSRPSRTAPSPGRSDATRSPPSFSTYDARPSRS